MGLFFFASSFFLLSSFFFLLSSFFFLLSSFFFLLSSVFLLLSSFFFLLSLVCFLWLGFSLFFFPFFFLCFSGKRYLWFKASQTELSIAFTGGFLFVLRAGPAWNSDRFHANRRFRFSIQRSNRAEVAESNSFTPNFQINCSSAIDVDKFGNGIKLVLFENWLNEVIARIEFAQCYDSISSH